MLEKDTFNDASAAAYPHWSSRQYKCSQFPSTLLVLRPRVRISRCHSQDRGWDARESHTKAVSDCQLEYGE